MTPAWLEIATISLVAFPAGAALILALGAWSGRRLEERWITRVVALAFSGSTLSVLAALIGMIYLGIDEVRVDLGAWFEVAEYRFGVDLVLDRLSLPFAALGAVLVGLIGAFSRRYLHREPGFLRFFLLLTVFGMSVEVVALAGSLELLFFGWELIGLSSALLIAFFDERSGPVQNGLRAFITYRICDVGLLSAAVWLHHSVGSAEVMSPSGGATPWAGLVVPASVTGATLIGVLLCVAAMGKSAQVPFGGWLPRAMEGPTPSSAIFYGALSVHLGPYLLLRAAPVLERAPVAAGLVVVVGALTAAHATFVGRVQTDIKSALAYASMTQVGIIFVEIGLGFRFLAVAHIVGHACVRTLQLLRAPSLLHDHHHLEQSVGAHLPRTAAHLERLVPRALQPWLYRLALERGYFDSLLGDHVVGRFVQLLRGVDRLEERWVSTLEGGVADEPSPEPREVHQ